MTPRRGRRERNHIAANVPSKGQLHDGDTCAISIDEVDQGAQNSDIVAGASMLRLGFAPFYRGPETPKGGTMARPCFAYFLAHEFLRMQVEKGVSEEEFIRLPRLIFTGAGLFEAGAILGHAFRNQAELFVMAYCPNGKDDPSKAIEVMHTLARGIAETGTHAATLLDLYMADQLATQGQPPTTHWSTWLLSLSAENTPVTEEVVAFGMMQAVKGAGFGMQCPERTEKLVPAMYMLSASDQKGWRNAFKDGVVDSPEPPEPKSLAEREHDAKADFAAFCRQYHPEVLGPLGLEAS